MTETPVTCGGVSGTAVYDGEARWPADNASVRLDDGREASVWVEDDDPLLESLEGALRARYGGLGQLEPRS